MCCGKSSASSACNLRPELRGGDTLGAYPPAYVALPGASAGRQNALNDGASPQGGASAACG